MSPVLRTLLGMLGAGCFAVALASAQPLFERLKRRRRVPVTESNRALRGRRANVVLNADARTIAFALGPFEAELGSLQGLADRLAGNDRADDEPRHTR